MPAAVCLLSGGLDSSTTLYLARDQGHELYALSFDYGQRHLFELYAARKIAQAAQVREHRVLRTWDIGAIVLEMALLGALLLGLTSGGADARAAGNLLVGGPFTALFWSLVVVTGLAVPLLIELVEAKKKLSPTILAPALLLVGGFSLRWILVVAGQSPLG